MKIREKKNNVLTQHSVKAHTKPLRSKVCLSHGGGLIRGKLFLKSVRRAIEIVQTKLLRWVLGVNKFCSPNACRSEVGRFPMRTKTKRRAIKFWLKFWEPEHQNKLSGTAFADLIGQDKKELQPSKLKRVLKLSGLGDIWSVKTNTPANMNYYDIDSLT